MERKLLRSAMTLIVVLGLFSTSAVQAAGAPGSGLMAAPGNDDFDTPVVIGALPYSSPSLDTSEATVAVDDPTFPCTQSVFTVWYRYTATSSGVLTIDTRGSSYDTTLAVWTGSRGSLTSIACNDDVSDTVPHSTLTVLASAGQTYYIEAAGYAFSGMLTVHVRAATGNYGLIKVGTTSAGKVFSITNDTTADLHLGTVTFAGSYPGQFAKGTDTCSGATLTHYPNPVGGCSITVSFKPTTAGAKSAYLSIPSDAAGSPHKIVLTGKGGTEQSLNGGFNTYPSSTAKVPTSWTAAGFATTDGKDTANKKEGTASVKIANTAVHTKTLTQTRNVSGGSPNMFVLSLWAKGQNIPTSAGYVRAQVLLYNGATLLKTNTITFPNGSYPFQKKSLAFTAPSAYNKIVIKLTYSKATGAVWFDGLSLLRSP